MATLAVVLALATPARAETPGFLRPVVQGLVRSERAASRQALDLRGTPLPRGLRNVQRVAPGLLRLAASRAADARAIQLRADSGGCEIQVANRRGATTFTSTHVEQGGKRHGYHRICTSPLSRREARWGTSADGRPYVGRSTRRGRFGQQSRLGQFAVGLGSTWKLPSGRTIAPGSWAVEVASDRGTDYVIYGWSSNAGGRKRVATSLRNPVDRSLVKRMVDEAFGASRL